MKEKHITYRIRKIRYSNGETFYAIQKRLTLFGFDTPMWLTYMRKYLSNFTEEYEDGWSIFFDNGWVFYYIEGAEQLIEKLKEQDEKENAIITNKETVKTIEVNLKKP